MASTASGTVRCAGLSGGSNLGRRSDRENISYWVLFIITVVLAVLGIAGLATGLITNLRSLVEER